MIELCAPQGARNTLYNSPTRQVIDIKGLFGLNEPMKCKYEENMICGPVRIISCYVSLVVIPTIVILTGTSFAYSACEADYSGFWVEDIEHTIESVSKGKPHVLESMRAMYNEPHMSMRLTRAYDDVYIAVYREISFKHTDEYDYDSGEYLQWALNRSGEDCSLTTSSYPPYSPEQPITSRFRGTEGRFCFTANTADENWICYVRSTE